MNTLDLNCDAGESTHSKKIGNDAELFQYVTSVNIACGLHGGDAQVMYETVEMALKNDLTIGAHPSFDDREGFGRREMHLSDKEIYDTIIYQLNELSAVIEAQHGKLHHVKPHGALYNMAAKNKNMADAIAKAIFDFDKSLILLGLSGSELINAAKELSLHFVNEVFADRTYTDDGNLTSRKEKNALITDVNQSLEQVLMMVNEKKVKTISGKMISIEADTLCIHGDGEHAVEFAKAIREKLIANNILIKSFD
jgi:5-oxoprolinase (ATP-hydrolysing) subunit A